MSGMKIKKKSSGQHFTSRTQDVVGTNYQIHVSFMLFAHAFCGCDTTSSINRLGKSQISGKSSGRPDPRYVGDEFYNDIATCTTMVERSFCAYFQVFFSPAGNSFSLLLKLRKQEYHDIISRGT